MSRFKTPAYLTRRAVPHARKIMQLYKKCLRVLWSCAEQDRLEYRYQACLLRQKFDENKDMTDKDKIQELIDYAEWYAHWYEPPVPYKFPHSPGGLYYERDVFVPDSVFDVWHPMDKAEYPVYFARRDIRKAEHIKWWNEKYLKSAESGEPNKFGSGEPKKLGNEELKK